MDDELVTHADRLKIGQSNLRLSSKSKEPTLQVVLDALKLTSFYNAFEISTDVPEIYMQEFWVTVFRHHYLLRFKLNGKSHTVNVDNFRDMLKICPKLPGQKFEEPPLKEDILSFIRDLGHIGEIKFLSDVNVNHMHQPWGSFAAIINKCLSGKTTALESLRLSRAQILWGMYHNKKVDYVYLLWEDLVFQLENKNSKKNNDMDNFMFTTIRVISKHQDTQVYGAILPQHLSNQAMLESEAYMTYRAYATEAEQLKRVIERSKTQTHSSHASGSGVDEGTGVKLGVLDVPSYNFDDEQISWKSSDEEDDDEVSLNDVDDDVHNKMMKIKMIIMRKQIQTTKVMTLFIPSFQLMMMKQSKMKNNEESDEEVRGANIEEEEMEEEATHEEDESNKLYRDVNVNMEGRDTAMTNASLPNVQATQET
ncbi:hypothetical protein Tco_1131293 [Tanacetum coccineum]